ncbi:MAG: tRNA (guanosine(37)-N1)-methyltransferase TrmD [Candidatus Marinimicrobia bacterium]|nr:tRNA (guanosine(37)-N1)-methyltransferase TrmD [Candidatus Neomarinimicrobiota bacterium]
MVKAVVATSILGRAAAEIVEYQVINLFDFADPPHNKIDDEPYGGGAGMIMKPEPIFRAYDAVAESDGKPDRVIFPTPDGAPFTQRHAENLAGADHIMIISGHYKGVDQRVRDALVTDEYSIGDFVLTGGELPALMMLDAVVRLRDGALGSSESARTDSFSMGLLDGPHYTRPREFRGQMVPEVLVSGDHGKIAAWRQERREAVTMERRPDIWAQFQAGQETDPQP